MTVTRTAISAYLDGQFSALASSVGQSLPAAIGFAPDIDNALRKLGITESDLPTAEINDSLRDAVFALGEYYAAKRIWRQLGDRVDTQTGENSYKFGSQLSNVKAMMNEAADLCAALGYAVDGRKSNELIFEVC